MLDGAAGAGHSTPICRAVGGAEEDAPTAFRSPSPEDADAVRVGSPRDDSDDIIDQQQQQQQQQQQATPQRAVGPNPRDAASPADAAMGTAPDGGMGAVAADATQEIMPASTPASRAGFPGFALGQGQHSVLQSCRTILSVEHLPTQMASGLQVTRPAHANFCVAAQVLRSWQRPRTCCCAPGRPSAAR